MKKVIDFMVTPKLKRRKLMTNLLGDNGNISLHAAQYAAAGSYGMLRVWKGAMVATYGGESVLDGYWSDTDYVSKVYRVNRLVCTPIAGHKYLFRYEFMCNNDTYPASELEVAGETSAAIMEKVISSTNKQKIWRMGLIKVTAGSENILFCFRGPYTQYGTYYKNLMLFDVTAEGDDSLTDTEIYNKYMSFGYFDNSKQVEF